MPGGGMVGPGADVGGVVGFGGGVVAVVGFGGGADAVGGVVGFGGMVAPDRGPEDPEGAAPEDEPEGVVPGFFR
ncbi:hypothetical protein OG851_43625 (plasmid) [Streptomyces sp. NBC_00161]|uniref:hypothetical protein n=1 Tax=Streptomyces sp. NBC_00161 TaxID=2975671 RepID=UPI0032543EA2